MFLTKLSGSSAHSTTWISFFSIPFRRSTRTPPGPTALWTSPGWTRKTSLSSAERQSLTRAPVRSSNSWMYPRVSLSRVISAMGGTGSSPAGCLRLEGEDRARARVEDRHRADRERTAAGLSEFDRGPLVVVDGDLPDRPLLGELHVGARLRDDQEPRLLRVRGVQRLQEPDLHLAGLEGDLERVGQIHRSTPPPSPAPAPLPPSVRAYL